jgi:hypothetical protein
LETAKARVEAAQSEAKVMDEYRELVDTARHNLQVIKEKVFFFFILIFTLFFFNNMKDGIVFYSS